MPTGYTWKLCDGEQSFEEFVWTCARTMGALIMQRDDPTGPARPDPEPDRPREEVARDRAELDRVLSLTDEQCAAEAAREHAERSEEWERSARQVAAVRARLVAMRSRVADWTPPTPDHVRFKEFMLEQLDGTIEHDGSMHGEPPEALDGPRWRSLRIDSLRRSIDSSKEHGARERKARESRNAWVAALRASVPHPEDAREGKRT